MSRLLKNALNETYGAWMHLKTIRVFCESVLRYGVPPEFVVAIMHPRNSKACKDKLTELHGQLTNQTAVKHKFNAEQEQLMEQHMMSLNLENTYEPYVILPFHTFHQ